MNVPPSFVSFTPGNANGVASSSALRDTLKFFLVAPSRGLARLLWLDRLLFLDSQEEPNQIMSSSLVYNADGGTPMAHMTGPSPSAFNHYPGPWSFFASGYAVSLFAMVRRVHKNVSCLNLTSIHT